MRILLDTHVMIWMFEDSPRLKQPARDLLLDPTNQLYCSDASLWEVAIKHKKSPDRNISAQEFARLSDLSSLLRLEIKREHILALQELELLHNDPFDRMLLCQAKEERIYLLSHDAAFGMYNYEQLIVA